LFNNTTAWLTASVDDLKIWDKALSETEITNVMNHVNGWIE
jgi:hypothetical protein